MKHRRLPFTVVALALTSVVAIAQTKKVFPAIDTTKEGPSQFGPPFNGSSTSTSRYQQICGTSVVTGLTGAIKQLAWRRANTLATAGNYSAWKPAIDLTLSTSARPSAKMSNVFSKNVGADAKLFFSGVLNWPAENKLNPGPSPFSYTVPGSAAFLYVPTKGDLLIDLVRKSGVASPSLFFLDAHPDVISAKPPQITTLGPACPVGKNINYVDSNWIPGARGRSLLYNAAGNSLTMWSLGFKKQTFDLGLAGAPGCKLYHDNLVLIPGLTSNRPSYTARWDLFFDIPDDSKLGGVTVMTQYVLLQDTAIGNALGWSVSDGKQVITGSFTPGRPYFMEISASPTATSATLVQATGFITEFTY